jgi:hypothetical protein
MTGDYSLAYGTHATPDQGRCAMEWVSHLAGEPHSDQPGCVSPVLRALCIALNDGLDDAPRQRLRPYLTRTIGTAGDGLDPARAWMAMDWLIRTYTPAWLRLARLPAPATELASLAPVLDERSLHAALEPLERARREARGIRSGARTAPWAATRAAARETAWACAGAAAWAAARIALGDIAGDRARATARAAAADAAAAAAHDALFGQHVKGGRAAAKESARAALAPTAEQLSGSILALLDRMLPAEPLDVPLSSRTRQLTA